MPGTIGSSHPMPSQGPRPALDDSHLPSIAQRRAEGVKGELASLGKDPRRKLAPAEKPMAGYLMAAAAAKSPIDHEETVHALHDGLQTMVAATKAVPNGRNNILSDLSKGKDEGLIRHKLAGELVTRFLSAFTKESQGKNLIPIERELLKCLPEDMLPRLRGKGLNDIEIMNYRRMVTVAGLTQWAKTARCNGLSALTMNHHAPKLEPSQSLLRCSADNPSHAWTTLSLRNGEKLELDPWPQNWSRMIPVAKEHSYFGAIENEPQYSIDHRVAGFARQDAAFIKDAIDGNRIARNILENSEPMIRREYAGVMGGAKRHFNGLAGMGTPGYSWNEIYAKPPHILSDEFREQAKSGLEKLERRPAQSHSTAHPALPETLQSEILALGVARKMGFPIKQGIEVVREKSAFMEYAHKAIDDTSFTSEGWPARLKNIMQGSIRLRS